MAAPRSIVIAVYVWSINAMCVILNAIGPFHTEGVIIGADWELINATATAANVTATQGIGLFGILLEFVNIINLFIQLLLGPFVFVPDLLNVIGITGVIHTVIVAAIWIPWMWILIGLITGRALRDML